MLKKNLDTFLFISLFCNGWVIGYGQSDTTVLKVPGNSCETYFMNTKTSIHYSYTDSTQTHDYSNNWDIDGDGQTDGVYFIGTNGAHLYFYLRIVLSSDKIVRNFPFLELDWPCLGNVSDLKSAGYYPPPFFPRFVVDNFNSDELGNNTNKKIYLHLDKSAKIPVEWIKRELTSHYILVSYENQTISLKNFIE